MPRRCHRTFIASLVSTLGLAVGACSSGSYVVVRQPPPPRPVPIIVEPLEIDIGRPHNGRLFIQTNRPAYVAIFEIVPERGVTMVYPVSTRQRRFVVSGLREVPVWWEGSRVTYRDARFPSVRSQPSRYIYALASEQPLRVSDDAFRNDYLRDALGARAYWATNPYTTMRALVRHFLPTVPDEAWAEDAYTLSRAYATERYGVTRVYCRDGTVYEVPAEMADRVWCGSKIHGVASGRVRASEAELTSTAHPERPDSVVSEYGRRVAVRSRGVNGRGPVDRVKEPPVLENAKSRHAPESKPRS